MVFDACRCRGGDVAPTEVNERRLDVTLLLQAAEGSNSDDHTAGAAATTTTDGEVEKEQVPFTTRQGLLWLFLFGCMISLALKYTHGCIWFSAFSAILMSLPITELFSIINDYDLLNSDVELPPAADVEAQEADTRTEEARGKMTRCILRGLVLLGWLFMMDLTRRMLTTDELGKLEPWDIPVLISCVTFLSTGFCCACQIIQESSEPVVFLIE
uniref:Uncharacterized protein n=1 Tax=Leersia perrieri TaxID=77586 RepID=A0A0D9XPY9_9ORYZ